MAKPNAKMALSTTAPRNGFAQRPKRRLSAQPSATDPPDHDEFDDSIEHDDDLIPDEFVHDDLTDERLDETAESIDDPVRMYLMQMGEIPLLNRARRWRRPADRAGRGAASAPAAGHRFRAAGGDQCLEKVRDGQLRLDRTVEVSVTNTAEKRTIMRRLSPNLITLRQLLVLQPSRLRSGRR